MNISIPAASVFRLKAATGRRGREFCFYISDLLEFLGLLGIAKWRCVILFVVCKAFVGAHAVEDEGRQAVAELRQLGVHVFKDATSSAVTEVVANGNRAITNEHMEVLASFPELTDISLEGTRVGSEGVRHLKVLKKLEWLNLYQCSVGDAGVRHLSGIKNLKLLPVGNSGVTDAGLVHLGRMAQLEYLGLRGNTITGKGMIHLAQLKKIKGLHLGETKVDDEGIKHLAGFVYLERLWLHDTRVTDRSIDWITKFSRLRELDLRNTAVSAEGVARLRDLLPKCKVLHSR